MIPTMPRLRPLALLATLLLAAPARADEAPPESRVVCKGLKQGDPCVAEDGPGYCVHCKYDTSGGSPKGGVDNTCLRCRVFTPPEVPPAREPDPSPATPPPAATTPPPAQPTGACRLDDGGGAGLLLLLALAALWRLRALDRRPA